MKLLFDQNRSSRLVNRLVDLDPDAASVSSVGLDTAWADAVWNYAGQHGFRIVTKDADSSDMSVLRERSPTVLWRRLGNGTTRQIEDMLRANHAVIDAWSANPNRGVLAVQ